MVPKGFVSDIKSYLRKRFKGSGDPDFTGIRDDALRRILLRTLEHDTVKQAVTNYAFSVCPRLHSSRWLADP